MYPLSVQISRIPFYNYYCYYYYIIIELKHSKTILENTVEIEPQPIAFHFKNHSQYSSRSK